MFCPKCGQPYAEGMRFCEHCGAALPQGAPAGYTPQSSVYQQPASRPAPDPVDNSVMGVLRRLATSPLYLVGAIAYSCAILFQVIASVTESPLTRLVDQYMSFLFQYGGFGTPAFDALDQLNNILPVLRGASIGSAVVSQIPAILIAVGIWMMFASAKDRSGSPMKTTGLTIIKVILTICMVAACLLTLLLVVVMLVAMAVLAEYDGSVVPVLLIGLIAVVVVMALVILYYLKLASSVHTMRGTVRSGIASDRVSAYAAVLSILGGVGAVLSMVGAAGLSSLVADAAQAAAGICFGIFLFQYRDKMRVLMLNPTAAQSGYDYEEPPRQAVRKPAENPAPAYQAPQPAGNPAPAYQATQSACSPATAYQATQSACSPATAYQATQSACSPATAYQAPPTTPVAAPSPFIPETTVLNEVAKQPNLQIIHVRDGNCVPIMHPRFRIGRDPAVVDYIVSDNTAVGRQHADILIHNGACFVMDLNSTNHTYLNGQMLDPGVEYPLQDGDELLLGNEAFRVKLS